MPVLLILLAVLALLTVLLVIYVGTLALMKAIKKDLSRTEAIIGSVYGCAILLFFSGMFQHGNDYFTAIDPVDFECYTPISSSGLVSLFFYQLLFHVALVVVWARKETLPPLLHVILLCCIVAGIAVNAALLVQVSAHDRSSIGEHLNDGTPFFIWAPAMAVVLASLLLYKSLRERSIAGHGLTYKNKFLNTLNHFIADRRRPAMVALFLLPVLFLCTVILLLFGQEPDGIVKVFTDTTMWRLSQQAHPPVLEHQGHYLCTVAAKGSPEIVRPVAIGRRGGRDIIVNRQLQVANAFEEVIQVRWPRLHRVIRFNYDRYGYNLSRKINTPPASNLVYLMMKPLEWLFLVVLYLVCHKPEEVIRRQYLQQTNL